MYSFNVNGICDWLHVKINEINKGINGVALKGRRCHIKHLKRGEWKSPINNTNTTSNPREKKKKKSATTDARHNIRFRKLILGAIEEAANS